MKPVEEYFKYYVSRKPLLGRLKYQLEEGRSPLETQLARRSAELDLEYVKVVGTEIDLRILLSKLVDDLELSLLEALMQSDKYSAKELKEEDYALYSAAVGFNISVFDQLRFQKIFGFKVKPYLDPTYKLVKHSDKIVILLPDGHLGTLSLYVGESPEGEPGVWYRRIDDTIQVGVAFKFNNLGNYLVITP